MANTAFDHASALTLPGSTTNNGLVRWGDTSAGSFGNITGITSDGSNLSLLTRGEVRFSDADSSHYVAFEAPATVSTSYTMAFPAAVPAANDYLKVTSYSGGAGVLEWASVSADTNTTYLTSWVDSSANAILRLTPSSGSADDLTIIAGTNITLTPSGDNLTIDAAAGGSCVVCDTTPVLGGSLDASCETILNIGAAGNDIDANGYNAVNGSNTAPSYAFTSDPDMGFYYMASGRMGWSANGGVDRIVFDGCGAEILVRETCNGNLNNGITINQSSSDNEIFTLKSSDVEHNTTDVTETDTFAKFNKSYGAAGGLNIYGLTDGNAPQAAGIILSPILGIVAQATKTAAGVGILSVNAGVKAASGGGVADAAANGNLFAIRGIATGNAKFLVDQDGDIFYDGSAAAYDSYCDAELTRTLAHTMQAASCEPSTIIRNKWDDFTAYNEQSLIDAGILGGPVIGVDAHDRGLVSLTQLQRLHNGAIWQLHSKLNDQAEELTTLKEQLTALTEGK